MESAPTMKSPQTASGASRRRGREFPFRSEQLRGMDAYWRAANYLSVGQIYLLDNPLLKEPLKREQIKPRLLGRWGTTPGLNFIYVHLNRVIKEHDLSMIYVAGPGHGGPGLVANVYREGTYSEVYSNIGRDEEGMKRLFTQFSFPRGIPSHVAPETPGSIHEGGELGVAEATRVQGKFLRDVMKRNLDSQNFRISSADENKSNRWQDVLEVTDRCYTAEIYPYD
jgi:xylulose-5-phosphate/fructose-6-phosphate phosphoketolase